MIGVGGIDPHGVVVDVLVLFADLLPGHPTIDGAMEPGIHGIDGVDIHRVGHELVVVLRTHRHVIGDLLPTLAAVGALVDAALVALGLDDGVDDIGVGG